MMILFSTEDLIEILRSSSTTTTTCFIVWENENDDEEKKIELNQVFFLIWLL